ncbi:toll/interleukin-1 receptor domain-containing protein [Paracoccus aestuarii]|uniref:Toll/interleukin-1 receptor domain-containing protein n=1 Tax=Paracoccus aestuarii TaxID=453842 RepID=A0A419A2B6_9RHOB|nr:toll/interleukin-1 receptor domain-containing protein [Paracoccus aestuarii]RJL07287.1 toll/interleukin-1 receptor domain-containing protein [Paracoccus aestuarii]WCR00090.1 toll/interleukin-1 receptor domain-containing protein [Paracoccus aestuarii]
MGHVFISYSSRHRDLTRSFAERLEEEGYRVWWDRELEAWGGYEPQIREALSTTSAVVVIWSPGAAASDYVRAEVRAALRLGRLVNLRAPDFPVDEVPLDFRENHMLPLDIDDMGPILKTMRTVWEGRVPQGQTPAYSTYAEDFGENLFDPRHRALPQDIAMVTPSVLLQAPFEVSEFVDATGILADLMDWCRGAGAHAETPRPTAGRLLHGPGGLGKTRTMIEAVRRLRAEGWLAGFLPTPIIGDLPRAKLRHRALEQAMAATDTPGTMMVLDYAEARGTEVIELARMARRHDRAGLPQLRIVLLSRGAGWWQEIYRTEPEIQVVFNRRGAPQGDVIAVEPLPSGECRLAVFDAMRDALKPVLAKQAEAGRFPPLSEQPVAPDRRARLAQDSAYARPLALQMEALLSLGGEDGGGDRRSPREHSRARTAALAPGSRGPRPRRPA